MKLALGTVQFGLNYGIANRTGQVSSLEVPDILATARDAGISLLDTAIAYGESEARLGAAGVEGFRVVSKLPGLTEDDDIAKLVDLSIGRLAIPSLYALLLHRSGDLVDARGIHVYETLCALKKRGLVKKIGVSIYDPGELEAILDRFDLDIVQAPYNIFDRRLVTSGWLERLKCANVEVHTRSAFLQGLLLLAPDQRPAKFTRWAGLFARWDAWLEQTGESALSASLNFVCDNDFIDHVLVGVDTRTQLSDIIEASRKRPSPAPDWLSCDDLDLINPVNWNSL